MSWTRPSRSSPRPSCACAGQRTIPDRRVSLVDPDARPIRSGSPRRPTEFGYKARVADTAEGFVIADIPERGNPPDDSAARRRDRESEAAGMRVRTRLRRPRLRHRHRRRRARPPRHRDAVIPRRQRAAPIEHSRAWRRRYRFRNGLEGRISQLKRKGLRRTRLRSLAGAQTWVGGITLAHNLQRMALLT